MCLFVCFTTNLFIHFTSQLQPSSSQSSLGLLWQGGAPSWYQPTLPLGVDKGSRIHRWATESGMALAPVFMTCMKTKLHICYICAGDIGSARSVLLLVVPTKPPSLWEPPRVHVIVKSQRWTRLKLVTLYFSLIRPCSNQRVHLRLYFWKSSRLYII